MAESVVTQVTEVPGKAIDTLRKTPVLAIGMAFFVLVIVLLIEAYRPGMITGPIRRLLKAVGVKTA